MPEAQDASALLVAYGYLWLFQGNAEADKNAHFAFEARRQLSSFLTKEQQKIGIQMARTLADANSLPFIGPLRTALEEIERLGWKEGLGAEHAIATHYEIRKIVHKALRPFRYTGAA